MAHPSDYSPEWTRPLRSLQDELARVLAQVLPPKTVTLRPETWTPAIDLFERPTELLLRVDLPGVAAGAIDLTVDGTTLTLQGERPAVAMTAEPQTELIQERPAGGFHRQVTLPCEVEADAIRAEVRDGVLEVLLPKAEALRPRSIPIRGS